MLFSVCCLVLLFSVCCIWSTGCCVKLVNFVAQIGLKAGVNIYGDRTEVKARYANTFWSDHCSIRESSSIFPLLHPFSVFLRPQHGRRYCTRQRPEQHPPEGNPGTTAES